MEQYTDKEITHIRSTDTGGVHGQSIFDRANNQWVSWGMGTVFNVLEKTMLNIQAFNNSMNSCNNTLNEHQAKFNEINKTIRKQDRRIKQLIESMPENVHTE